MTNTTTYLPYEEPKILRVIILSSFLLLLNFVHHVIDRFLYCGLVGQLLLGILWGAPGANWIDLDMQKALVEISYLGLLLIVYEGGLLSSIHSLKSTIHLSALVATTGVIVPIGLSYSLLGYSNANALAAFSAGASLCCTSLGSTFTIMIASNLTNSKLGVVLTSAAMLDDIAGLVMLQVISRLDNGSFKSESILRPLFVSIGLLVVSAAVCFFIVKPLTKTVMKRDFPKLKRHLRNIISAEKLYFIVHSLLLFCVISGGTYAGASPLTAAYVSGITITWWDGLVEEISNDQEKQRNDNDIEINPPVPRIDEFSGSQPRAPENTDGIDDGLSLSEIAYSVPSISFVDYQKHVNDDGHIYWASGIHTFHKFYSQVLKYLLRPLFFATIGFSIPITQMFEGRLVWKGLVYACLMACGKLVTSIWLVRFKCKSKGGTNESIQSTATNKKSESQLGNMYAVPLLGFSMISRGEIGFLIASLAETKGLFSPDGKPTSEGSSEVYIIVIWAVCLCTLAGPISVGIIVRRLRQLKRSGHSRPLGIWQ